MKTQNAKRRTRIALTVVIGAMSTALVSAQNSSYPDLWGDEYEGAMVYRHNAGQVKDTDGMQRPDIHYAAERSPIGLYLAEKSKVHFTWSAVYHDTITPDTAYRVTMSFDRHREVAPSAADSAPDLSNYYRGSITAEDVEAYHRIIYRSIQDSVDLHLYHGSTGPRMALVVRPGGDATDLKLVFTGQDSLGIDLQGHLKIYLNQKVLRLEQAQAYQVSSNGLIIPLSWTASYLNDQGSATVGFTFATHNPELPLILQIGIPPLPMGGGGDTRNLNWSTYVGSWGGDEFTAVDVDEDGNAYVCGYTHGDNFPVSPGTEFFPPFQPENFGYLSAVMLKYRASDKRLMWGTYYGGDVGPIGSLAKTRANKLKVAHTGDQYVFVTGFTDGSDFSVYRDPLSPFALADEAGLQSGIGGAWVGAFDKLNGARMWATIISLDNAGFNHYLDGLAIDYDANSGLCIAGRIVSSFYGAQFPMMIPSGAYNRSDGSAFFACYGSDYTSYWQSTFGEYSNETRITDIAFGEIPGPQQVLWMTGSSANAGLGYPPLDVVPPSGGGFYQGTSGGTTDAFIARLDLGTRQLGYCSYWGGSNDDRAYALAVNDKSLWVVGYSFSTDLTSTECPNPGGSGVHHSLTNLGGGGAPDSNCDGFILQFNTDTWGLNYGTLIGGNRGDVLLDVTGANDRVYITGETRSSTGFASDVNSSYYFQTQFGLPMRRDALILALKQTTEPEVLWRTAFGGIESERGWGIAASATEVYLVGATSSQPWDGFPLYEFDTGSILDFFQDFNQGGEEDGWIEGYGYNWLMANQTPWNFEPYQWNAHDAFIASFDVSSLPVNTGDLPTDRPSLLIIPTGTDGVWMLVPPEHQALHLAVHDSKGRLVLDEQPTTDLPLIDLRNESGGLYLITVKTASGARYHSKLVKP